MNWDQVEGKWTQMKGNVRKRWGELTDDDIDRMAGRRDELEGILQQKYGKTAEEARRDVDTWMAEL